MRQGLRAFQVEGARTNPDARPYFSLWRLSMIKQPGANRPTDCSMSILVV
jgi:hypothetical protein